MKIILILFNRYNLFLRKIVWFDIRGNEKALFPLTFFNLYYDHPSATKEHYHRYVPLYIRIALLFFEMHFWMCCVIWGLVALMLNESGTSIIINIVILGLFVMGIFLLRITLNTLLTELLLFRHGQLVEVEIESEEIYDMGAEEPEEHIVCLKYRNAQGISTYVRIPAPRIFTGFRKFKPWKKYLILHFSWDKTQVIFYKSLRIPYKFISIKISQINP